MREILLQLIPSGKVSGMCACEKTVYFVLFGIGSSGVPLSACWNEREG